MTTNNVRHIHGHDDGDVDEVVERWRRGDYSHFVIIAIAKDEEQNDDMLSFLDDPPRKLEHLFGFMEILKRQMMELLYPDV